MRRSTRPALNALAGASLAALVSLPLVVGVSLAAEPERVPMTVTGADAARERVAGARADAAVSAVRAEREAQARAAAEAEQARLAAERTAQAERASRAQRTGDPRSIARAMLAARGQASQFGCLDRLWTKESGWNPRATNPSSGAFGIPQSLPAGKMASAGADWRTNPATQIEWGLGYIASRYGSPCAAWRHSQSHNWY